MHQTNTLLSNIRRIVRLYDSMLRPVCDRYGLAPIEATIISFLQNNPGRDTAADIVELRMLSKSNVSQAVESLIQKSLLQRRQDTEGPQTDPSVPLPLRLHRLRTRLKQCGKAFESRYSGALPKRSKNNLPGLTNGLRKIQS